MFNNENLVEVLNDLIRINNDRIEGYNRGAKEAQASDVDLKGIFSKMADESRQYLSELTREVVKLGGEPASGTTTSGKIYRAWMDVKATFTGKDRLAVLSNCEFGEDAAQKAYQEALTTDESLTTDIRQMIANQKASLKVSHDTIKKLRDTERNAKSDNWSTGSDRGFDGNSGTSSSSTKGTTGSLNDADDDVRGTGFNSGSGNLGNL
jgi:uncharacterized protein (TIGR02284 family)